MGGRARRNSNDLKYDHQDDRAFPPDLRNFVFMLFPNGDEVSDLAAAGSLNTVIGVSENPSESTKSRVG